MGYQRTPQRARLVGLARGDGLTVVSDPVRPGRPVRGYVPIDHGLHGHGLGEDNWLDEMRRKLTGYNPPVDPVEIAAHTPTASGTTTTAADFVSSGGVCKPKNFTTLEASQEFQRQLNRVAHVKGFGKIGADGDIGSGTLSLLKKVQAASGGAVMGDTSNCLFIAADVDILGQQARAFADSLNAPATVTDAFSLKTPGIIKADGSKIVKPGANAGIGAELAKLTTLQKVAVASSLGGIAYLLYTASNKRGGKKRR